MNVRFDFYPYESKQNKNINYCCCIYKENFTGRYLLTIYVVESVKYWSTEASEFVQTSKKLVRILIFLAQRNTDLFLNLFVDGFIKNVVLLGSRYQAAWF